MVGKKFSLCGYLFLWSYSLQPLFNEELVYVRQVVDAIVDGNYDACVPGIFCIEFVEAIQFQGSVRFIPAEMPGDAEAEDQVSVPGMFLHRQDLAAIGFCDAGEGVDVLQLYSLFFEDIFHIVIKGLFVGSQVFLIILEIGAQLFGLHMEMEG